MMSCSHWVVACQDCEDGFAAGTGGRDPGGGPKDGEDV